MDAPASRGTEPTRGEGPTGSALLLDGQPRWEGIHFEVLCSRCGYNLRMLTEPRCPECGLTFEWGRVLEAGARRSSFLFEHHWRRHPVRSWAKTLWRSFRPFRFWREVSIHDRIRPGPLWFLLLTAPVWLLVTLHGLAALGWLALECLGQLLWGDPSGLGRWLYRLDSTLRFLAIYPTKVGVRYCLVAYVTQFGALLATLGFLCGLRQTLGRRRLRAVHMVRVVAYASTPVCVLWGGVFLLLNVIVDPIGSSFGRVVPLAEPARWAANLVKPAVLGVFVAAGLKRYARIPRAWLVAGTAAGVAFLFAFIAFLGIQIARMGG